MTWTKNDYPESMKNLNESTRNKAIEIANALLEDGYEEGRAISIGISQAEDMKNTSTNSQVVYHVVPHDDVWALKKEHASRATELFSTKVEAIDEGQDLIKKKDAQLVIHRQDGTIERMQNTGS